MNVTQIVQNRSKWYNTTFRWQYGSAEAAAYMQRLTYTKEQLITSITNMLKIHEYEVESAETLIGSLIGLFSTQTDPDNIKIDGMKLLKLFDYSKLEPPIKISIQHNYSIDIASLRKMLADIK